MTDLKTLKDIEWGRTEHEGKEMMRKEAIKWIKESEGKKFFCTICEEFDCTCGSSDCFKIYNLEEIRKWIKYYHNITEEDLKKRTELKHLFGVSISRIKELFDLFAKSGYDLNQNSDWKEIKRNFFNITGEDSEEKTDLRNELKKKGQLTPKINNQLKTIEKEDKK